MKCKNCNGTGYVEYHDRKNNSVVSVPCYECKGTGWAEQTNEEWFCGMYTEAKAEWLADHMKCSKCPQHHQCNGYHGGCVALMVEWLKQPHEETK